MSHKLCEICDLINILSNFYPYMTFLSVKEDFKKLFTFSCILLELSTVIKTKYQFALVTIEKWLEISPDFSSRNSA